MKSSQTKIAALVLAALILFIIGIKFLRGNKLLKNEKEYYSEFVSARGIKEGDKVILRGVEVGSIENVEFKDNFKKIRIDYTVNDEVILPVDSKITIDAGLPGFGSPTLKLLLGDEKQVLPENSKISSFQDEGLADQAGELIDEAKPTVRSLNETISHIDSVALSLNSLLTGANGLNIERSLQSLNSTLANFNTSSQKLSNIINRQAPNIEGTLGNLNSLSNTLSANEAKIDLILNNLLTTSNNFSTLDLATTQRGFDDTVLSARTAIDGTVVQLETTMTNADVTINKLNAILKEIEEGDGTLSLLLNNAELYNNLNDTARDLDRLILDIEEQPQKYIPNISVFGGRKGNKN